MKNYLMLILTMAIVVACGGDDVAEGAPQVNKDYLSVTPNLELLADGQTTDIAITANCNWAITKDADWLTVSPMAGTGTQTITISAMKNTSHENRMAVIYVKGGSLPARTITVTQYATGVAQSLSVNVEALNYERDGGSQNFVITSNTSWTITCPDWCSLSMTTGTGNATVTVTASKNETTAQRSGQVVISGEGIAPVAIVVTQQAGEDISHEPGAGDNQLPS